MTINFRTRFN